MLTQNKKILFVEDEKLICSMYETKLKANGFEVFIANSGIDGFKMAIQKKPDFIVLDIILPQLDGFSVLSKLKKNANTKKIPIIILTNLSTEEDRLRSQKLGAIDYLIKADLTPSEVSDKIKHYFRKSNR